MTVQYLQYPPVEPVPQGDVALVLPKNYAWGMRHVNDKIWGYWGSDEKSQQIWDLSQRLLEANGLTLDIVYEDSAFPIEELYSEIYYWNNTE